MASFPINVPIASSIPKLLSQIAALRKATTGAIRGIQREQKASGNLSAVLSSDSVKQSSVAIRNIRNVMAAFREAQTIINDKLDPTALSGQDFAIETASIREAVFKKNKLSQQEILIGKRAEAAEDNLINGILIRRESLVAQNVALAVESTNQGREAILQQELLNVELRETADARREIRDFAIAQAEVLSLGGVPKKTSKLPGGTEALNEERVAIDLVSRALADVNQRKVKFNDLTNVEAEVEKEAKAALDARNAAIRDHARLTGKGVAAIEAEVNATNMSTEALVANNEMTRTAIANKRRLRAELIGASIGMFVFGITITQTISGLAGLVSNSKESAKTVTFLSNTVKAALGPIQVFMGILQFWNIQNINLAMTNAAAAESNVAVAETNVAVGETAFFAATGVIHLRTSLLATIGTLGTIILIVAAFKAGNKELRGVLAGLATTVGILTAAFVYLRAAQIAETIATIITQMVGTGGAAAPIIAASIAGAAILAGLAVGVATASFDTQPGMMKRVGKTGMAIVHEGETFSRPASIGDHRSIRSMMGSSGGTVINIFNRGDLDTNSIKRLDRKFNSLQIGSINAAGGF